jgi:hypothetical protein
LLRIPDLRLDLGTKILFGLRAFFDRTFLVQVHL